MKRILLVALALAMMVAPMAGCSSDDDKNSCKDACNKLKDCGSSTTPGSATPVCEDEATQAEIDCVHRQGLRDMTTAAAADRRPAGPRRFAAGAFSYPYPPIWHMVRM